MVASARPSTMMWFVIVNTIWSEDGWDSIPDRIPSEMDLWDQRWDDLSWYLNCSSPIRVSSWLWWKRNSSSLRSCGNMEVQTTIIIRLTWLRFIYCVMLKNICKTTSLKLLGILKFVALNPATLGWLGNRIYGSINFPGCWFRFKLYQNYSWNIWYFMFSCELSKRKELLLHILTLQ